MTFSRFPGGPEDNDFGPPPPPFRIRRRRFDFRSFGGYNRWIAVGVILILLYILADTLRGIYVDWLWFDGAGFEAVYSKMLVMKLALFVGGALLFAVFFGANVLFAGRSVLKNPAPGLIDSEAASLRRLYLVGLIAGTLFFAIIFGTIASGHWDVVLRFLNSQSFGVKEPQFNKDVGYYVFTLPAMHFFYGWLMGTAVLTTLSCAALYLTGFLIAGRRADSSQPRLHLIPLLIAIVALFIWRYWLDRFEFTLASHGTVFGATYTDVHARLPFIYIGMALGVVTALALLMTLFRRGITIAASAMIIWAAVAVIGGQIYPASVQRFTVQPNELEKERPYIQRNIDMTRRAFGLDKIDEQPFPAAAEVTPQEIADNPDTIEQHPAPGRRAAAPDLRPDPDDPAAVRVPGRRRRPLYHQRPAPPGHAVCARALAEPAASGRPELGQQAPAVHARLRRRHVAGERAWCRKACRSSS